MSAINTITGNKVHKWNGFKIVQGNTFLKFHFIWVVYIILVYATLHNYSHRHSWQLLMQGQLSIEEGKYLNCLYYINLLDVLPGKKVRSVSVRMSALGNTANKIFNVSVNACSHFHSLSTTSTSLIRATDDLITYTKSLPTHPKVPYQAASAVCVFTFRF